MFRYIFVLSNKIIHFVATDDDRVNPDYTDPCVEAFSAVCTYCCIISKAECSRDIRACDPIMVEDRHFHLFYIMVGCIIAVMCGCPLFAKFLDAILMNRCCKVITFHV